MFTQPSDICFISDNIQNDEVVSISAYVISFDCKRVNIPQFSVHALSFALAPPENRIKTLQDEPFWYLFHKRIKPMKRNAVKPKIFKHVWSMFCVCSTYRFKGDFFLFIRSF